MCFNRDSVRRYEGYAGECERLFRRVETIQNGRMHLDDYVFVGYSDRHRHRIMRRCLNFVDLYYRHGTKNQNPSSRLDTKNGHLCAHHSISIGKSGIKLLIALERNSLACLRTRRLLLHFRHLYIFIFTGDFNAGYINSAYNCGNEFR